MGPIRSISGHSGLLDGAMRFAAVYLIVAAALVAIPLWLRNDGLRTLVAAALGALLAVALTAAIGTLWDRPRPFVAEHFTPLISHAADASFPSDHLAALGAVTICVWFTSRRLGFIVGLIALVVAFARVYVGVTDACDDAVFRPFQAALGLSGHDIPPMVTTRSLDSVSPHRRPVLQCSKASKSWVDAVGTLASTAAENALRPMRRRLCHRSVDRVRRSLARGSTGELCKTHPRGEADDENTHRHICCLQPREANHAPLNDLEDDDRCPRDY